MKKWLFPTILLFSIFVNAQDVNEQFKKLSQIEGTWSMQTKRGIIYEQWELKENLLAGKSFKVMNGDTLLLERVNILIDGGDLFYIPVVEGQNNGEPVKFKLVSFSNDTFIFDNPVHDFPQRVIYKLPKNDAMHAWIEGLDKGVYRKSDFFYKRVK